MNVGKNRQAEKLLHHKTSGQAIPLIALMIVILVAMVGLSVDVGNTYAEERQAVAASNAASLAGMDVVIKNGRNAEVREAVISSLESNGMALGKENGQVEWTAEYLDAKGDKLGAITDDSNSPPDNVSYIKVTLNGKVDTFFARVVNRDTLPIDADSYASLCPPTSNIFPLAVDKSLLDLDSNNFRPAPTQLPGEEVESGVLTNREYRGKLWRRVYDLTSAPGGFSWLRWLEDQNGGNDLNQSWVGDGNIDQGFEEAPQPSGYPYAINPYPSRPGQLNASDWVYGRTGEVQSIMPVIQEKLATGQRLILPITDSITGQGSNAAYHVAALGVFVILDEGRTRNRGYFDMVYMGPPDSFSTACGAAPPETPTPLDLVGDVTVWPEHTEQKKEQAPLQYVVVLDVSGSMNLDFLGRGMLNNKAAQCTYARQPDPNSGCAGQPQYAWSPTKERRIYVAKQALEYLVEKMNIPSNPGYNSTRPSDEMALTWFNDGVDKKWFTNWTNDKNTLVKAIQGATTEKDPYLTRGGTNGAAGLYKASTLFNGKPATTTFNGKTVNYKRVVLFVTDGVSNQFFSTQL
ncbi:VWA domain-containing protein [Candidatus Gracilibacteria bacterium]|nr:VWA domain-containing protein [Candidatus Gracilibacteria bacterium]